MSCRSGGVLFLTKPAASRRTCLSKVLTNLRRAPVTWQAESEQDLILLSPAEEAMGRECSRGQSPPTHSTVLLGCRKSTIKTLVDHRSLFLVVSVNSKEMPLPSLQITREASHIFRIKNESSSIKTQSVILVL